VAAPSQPVGTKGELACPLCWLRFDKGEVIHLEAKSPTSDLACPHCRHKLPPDFLRVPYHTISLIGDQDAGKSSFLCMLTKVLPVALYREFGIGFQDGDPEVNDAINDLQKVMFETRSFAETMYEQVSRSGRTVAMPRPFTYTLTPAEKVREQCALIFYNNAGEHFQPGASAAELPEAQQLAHAAGIIYLFDPFNSAAFRAALKGSADPQMEKTLVDRQEALLAEIRACRLAMQNQFKGAKANIPVALVVGKSDAWLPLLEGVPIIDPLQEGLLEQATITKNSAAVQQLLQRLCPEVVTAAEALSPNLRFFAASAFGHAPTINEAGELAPDPAQLQPQQVEIPILWILSQICPALFRALKTASEPASPSA
jgi:hypothetical protein